MEPKDYLSPQSTPLSARPRHKMRRGCFISLGIVTVLLIILFIAAIATPTNSTTTAPQNNHPTGIVTSQPATTSPVNSPALLGSNIGTFIADYGQPNPHSSPSTGQYHFKTYPGENVDFLIVATDGTDGNAYTHLVYDINVQAPESGWTSTQASDMCGAFLPKDAVFKKQIATSNGIDKIYFSSSLASIFPASAFTDGQENQATPGSFDVLYLVRSDNSIDSCSIIIGQQQTQ